MTNETVAIARKYEIVKNEVKKAVGLELSTNGDWFCINFPFEDGATTFKNFEEVGAFLAGVRIGRQLERIAYSISSS